MQSCQPGILSYFPKELIVKIFFHSGFSCIQLLAGVDTQTKLFIETYPPFKKMNEAFKALHECYRIGVILTGHDHDKVLESIVEVLGKFDSRKSLHIARSIKNNEIYFRILSQSAEHFALQDHNYALSLTNDMVNLEDKIQAWVAIARNLSDKEEALELALRAYRGICTRFKIIGSALLLNSVLELLEDLDVNVEGMINNTLSLVMLQNKNEDRVWGLIGIAEAIYIRDPEKAKKTLVIALREIMSVKPHVRHMQMASIAEILIHLDPLQAVILIRTVLIESQETNYSHQMFLFVSEILPFLEPKDATPIIKEALCLLAFYPSSPKKFQIVAPFLTVFASIDPVFTLTLTKKAINEAETNLLSHEVYEALKVLLQPLALVDEKEALDKALVSLRAIDIMCDSVAKAKSYWAFVEFFEKRDLEKAIFLADEVIAIAQNLDFSAQISALLSKTIKFLAKYRADRAPELTEHIKLLKHRALTYSAIALEYFQNQN